MKNLLLKSSGILAIGFLAVIFMGCKDQRKNNDENRETYPPADDTDYHNDAYSNDTLHHDEGMNNSHNSQQNNQSGSQNSGSPDDTTRTNQSSSNKRPNGN
ncbi:hypothetical protein QW060_09570 [Myroides ceti]|uniref:Lipoprotein n=1 Tax=Paenimyroides ceti TaxID=395087 RepID=A0ABT8CUQ7_9FLAO|nr:hypothetical protein [Paenimyroides ceti]MDN3707378.1 hypothetical protein [Paenimyroides ceti]